MADDDGADVPGDEQDDGDEPVITGSEGRAEDDGSDVPTLPSGRPLDNWRLDGMDERTDDEDDLSG
jgi:hypothetical protein